MRRIICASRILFSTLALLLAAGCSTGALTSSELRCEYRHNPLGIDTPSPALSWVPESNQQQQKQTAYRILVASSAETLAKNVGDVWDTGKRISGNSIQIPYLGPPAKSNTQYFWKVRVWDKHDRPSPWSPPAEWTMGLLKPDDWHARWIGRGDDPTAATLKDANWIWPDETAKSPSSNPLALFRKTITIPKHAASSIGWLVLGSTGSATAYLDGQQIAAVDDPHHALSLDLSPLAPGKHALSIVADSGPHAQRRHRRHHPPHRRGSRHYLHR